MEQQEKNQVKALFAKYVALGFTTLDIAYSGSGDDGCFDSLVMTNAGADNRQTYDKQFELTDDENELAESLTWEIMEQVGLDGYENNEGGQGHIFVNLLDGKVEVEHENNIVTTESECFTLDLFTDKEAKA